MIVDFHAHILPGADHGSDGCETTQGQLALIARGGTDAVVATPHFYPHRHSIHAFLARRARAVALLKECELPAALRILLGAEVQVCEGLEEMEELDALCIKGTKVILLEMPPVKWTDRLTETVIAIAERGFVPVLAHIDRYSRRDVQTLMQRGIAAQINAEPFARFWSRRRIKPYLELEGIVALGSDLHGAEPHGYAAFLQMRELLGERAELIFAKTTDLLAGAWDVREL